MKKLIIIISVLLFSITTYSQNLLNWDYKSIIEEKGVAEDVLADESGNPYLYYNPGKDCKAEAYFINEDNICYLYLSVHEYSELTNIIKSLNENFEIVNDNLWKYYMKDYICYAEIVKYETTFIVGCYMKSYSEQIKTVKI